MHFKPRNLVNHHDKDGNSILVMKINKLEMQQLNSGRYTLNNLILNQFELKLLIIKMKCLRIYEL